jgi:hypothetical protein
MRNAYLKGRVYLGAVGMVGGGGTIRVWAWIK